RHSWCFRREMQRVDGADICACAHAPRTVRAPRRRFVSPMRAFAWFLGMFVVGFAVMAALTYPAWLLVYPATGWDFHKVGGRIGQVVLLVCLVLCARHLRVADRASWGYGLPRRDFLRELVKALGLGIATMVPIVIVMALLGLREWRNGIPPDAA